MLPVIIDAKLCKKDELCVHECPLSVLTVEEKGLIPTVHPKKTNYCINCGHCMAVCPTGAITLTAFDGQQATPFSKEELPDSAAVETLIKTRRSVRKFKKKNISVQEIGELIHISAYSPSGHNAQPVSWTVLDTPEKVYELGKVVVEWMEEMVKQKNPLAEKLFLAGLVNAWKKGNDAICRNAPAIAVAWAPKLGITPQADTIIATNTLELAAHAKGYGTCWAGYVILAAAYSTKVLRHLDIPEEHMAHGALFLGHPAVRYRSIPPRHEAVAKEQDGKFIFHARPNTH
ncbi:nitroreductase family protein [Desulfovibrio sp. JC022]|uniref:nitroreductase family protein n=1 Tax=Desulfovibrio sp. JC022 TaxID=2593642 RepID=UPI0013D7C27F|nr:nitroreductase family protein [Desulfovibrio sp. JC022]